jgi:hypothetical protein
VSDPYLPVHEVGVERVGDTVLISVGGVNIILSPDDGRRMGEALIAAATGQAGDALDALDRPPGGGG